MPRYLIERDTPAIGNADRAALRDASRKSNDVPAAMRTESIRIQWQHSYVAGNKTFCVHIAENEALIEQYAKRSGFPASVITPVQSLIDPVTAET